MSIGSYLNAAGIYLVNLLFGLYTLAVMLRFLLQAVRADPSQPFSQFLIRVTNPALRPLRQFIPSHTRVDWSSILLMLLLQSLAVCLIALLNGHLPPLISLLVISLAKLLQMAIYIYICVLIIRAVISWIQPGNYSYFTVVLHQLSEPLLRPIRRIAYPLNGIDWSVLILLIALNLALIILVSPLQDLGIFLSGYPQHIILK